MTYLFGALLLVAVLSLTAWFVSRRPSLEGALEGRCSGCQHWDWQVGQQALHAHRPFSLVMGELQPWEVGQTHREFVPNEEYQRVQRELAAALEAGDDARMKELQDRLDVLNPRRVSEVSSKPPAEYRGLSWLDFGACTLDEVVTARTDTCRKYTLISHEQLLRNVSAESRSRHGGAS
jgi:hypothetical protein